MRDWKLWAAAVLALPTLATAGRAADDAPPTFAKDVKPFLANYCQGCHAGRRGKGGYTVDSYSALFKSGKKGPLVVAGKPDESRLMLSLAGKGGKPMPPRREQQPTADEVERVKAWIAAGAKEDGTADKKGRGTE